MTLELKRERFKHFATKTDSFCVNSHGYEVSLICFSTVTRRHKRDLLSRIQRNNIEFNVAFTISRGFLNDDRQEGSKRGIRLRG